MFVLLVYDINVKRVNKILKTCRVYLTWVQNSVFEGNITEADLVRFIAAIKNVIREEDNVLVYKFNFGYTEKQVLGRLKGEPTAFF